MCCLNFAVYMIEQSNNTTEAAGARMHVDPITTIEVVKFILRVDTLDQINIDVYLADLRWLC